MISRLFLSIIFVIGLGATSAVAGCEAKSIDGESYTICTFNPAVERVEVFNLGEDGKPLVSFTNLRSWLAAQSKTLTFAMNAGMFGEDLKPIGLYVENGKTLRKLNRRSGSGNFHLKPNGVFYIDGGKPFVKETDAFAKLGIKPEFATQSGPMLVVDGEIHPKFSEDGPSEKIRNGVGVNRDGFLVFVKSESFVNFHRFATLFRDALNCENALFLDGSISSLYSLELQRNEGFIPLGPMVGIYEMQ